HVPESPAAEPAVAVAVLRPAAGAFAAGVVESGAGESAHGSYAGCTSAEQTAAGSAAATAFPADRQEYAWRQKPAARAPAQQGRQQGSADGTRGSDPHLVRCLEHPSCQS